MTKILFATDLHAGPDMPPRNKSDVMLFGSQASVLLTRLLTYAKETDVTSVVLGGDESFYDPNPHTHHARATGIFDIVRTCPVTIHRAIGNHDPIPALMDLGFRPKSYAAEFNEKSGALTRLVILQPDIGQDNGKAIYAYDADVAMNLIWGSSRADNTIVVSHWAFDRQTRGYPPIYQQSTGYVYRDTLFSHMNDLPPRTVVLSGHEHRANFKKSNACDPSENTRHIVIPAMTQKSRARLTCPVGLFAELETRPDNSPLRISFKHIYHAKGARYEIYPLPAGSVGQYSRPFIP
ncbi:MAG: hypothetical protein J0L77_09530 [Alphaproteobacteria bacterium]|nr:hypothetical protein [Alphaproteobacteria bacterium]